MKASLRQRILVPLFLGLFVLLAVFTALLYLSQQRYLNEARGRDRQAVLRFFDTKLKDDAANMAEVLTHLQRDARLVEPFRARDRTALLRVAGPIFSELKKQVGIRNLYFMTPDRVVFLRAHRPELFGDTIPRATTAEAARTNQPASGFELGRTRGLLTLRVVVPWYYDQQLLGYIELGEQINSFAEAMKRILDVEVFVLLKKSELDRTRWEDGMRAFNRTPHWEQYPTDVLVEQTTPVPQELDNYLKQAGDNRNALLDVSVRDRRYSAPASR
jgi:hypothetical protein